ncbi:hypothetical protein RZS08_01850, partial [Arthrospira platensis SPKY1]|nr:hypothetical protein [Arthrospira platensis SPKY1]
MRRGGAQRELGGERGLRRPAGEGGRAGEQLVRKQPHAVEVHAVVGRRVGRQLLGCHVGRRADRHAARGVAGDGDGGA